MDRDKLEQARALLRDVTPMVRDCGHICGAACCTGAACCGLPAASAFPLAAGCFAAGAGAGSAFGGSGTAKTSAMLAIWLCWVM